MSDHSPVLLNLNCENFYNPHFPSLPKKAVNWKTFSKNLENCTNIAILLKSNDHIEVAAQNLSTSI